MSREALTGSRIRERRIILGCKQADLARQIGISASYLNLIEHNRRKIGGKLLLDIAARLKVDASTLTERAEIALIASLREAAHGTGVSSEELDRVEEFVARFPSWANSLAVSNQKIFGLEQMIATLNDRITHDPQLAASVHEVLSTVASIRSTASILVEDKKLEPHWRDKFHANIDSDSRRLAASSKALVGFLDVDSGEAAISSSPQEEVEAFLAANDYCFPEIEAGRIKPADEINNASNLTSISARQIAESFLEKIVADSAQVKMSHLLAQLEVLGPDLVQLASKFQVSLPCIMRRLASVPRLGMGLVTADRSGALLFRKSIPGFTIPRYGAACPLWPIFQVMGQAGHIISKRIQISRHTDTVFQCFAAAELIGSSVVNSAPLTEATMLIVPVASGQIDPTILTEEMGSSCRICSRRNCMGRREPSILGEEF